MVGAGQPVLPQTAAPPGAPNERTGPRPQGLTAVSVVILVTGLILTTVLTWTALILKDRNDTRLLGLETQQAGEVISAAVPSLEDSITSAAEIAATTQGNTADFIGVMNDQVGPGRQFATASLLEEGPFGIRTLARLGPPPTLAASSGATAGAITASLQHATMAVVDLLGRPRRRLGYLVAARAGSATFAVYGERPLPESGRAAVASNSAFPNIAYAIYLGRAERPSALLASSFGRAPIAARSSITVPFGDTTLTIATAPTSELGGPLSERLPWLVGASGVILTLAAAWIGDRLVRRRRAAERDALQIRGLYSELGQLFGQQRTIAETLQHALLPQRLPDIPGLEVAARYVPGAQGVDIGGDWYSVIAVDASRFVFVIGDVSGRGVGAAAVMAQLSFMMNAYALEGHPPNVILEKCAPQLNVGSDGHFATALVGAGEVGLHQVVLANAGHLNPMLVAGGSARLIETATGRPLGVAGATYETVTVPIPPQATLVAFTDGLVERRGETLDAGLSRLLDSVPPGSRTVDNLLEHLMAELSSGVTSDDVAVLGLKWQS